MKQADLLRYASIGISAKIVREEEMLAGVKSEIMRQAVISRIETLQRHFALVCDLQYMKETGLTR